jgi:acyl-CoA thioester hydrolase
VPFVHTETIRFRDLDGLGHVNNAAYLTYLEQARIAFLRPLGADQTQMILARTEIDFRAQVGLEDERVEVEVRPLRLGTKSFELGYTVRARGRVVAEATSVLVAFDYATGETVPVPDGWRPGLEP